MLRETGNHTLALNNAVGQEVSALLAVDMRRLLSLFSFPLKTPFLPMLETNDVYLDRGYGYGAGTLTFLEPSS